jgi:hypothetical protein
MLNGSSRSASEEERDGGVSPGERVGSIVDRASWQQARWGVFVVLLTGAFAYFLLFHERTVVLHVSMHSAEAGVAQVFYDRGHGLAEADSDRAPVARGSNLLAFKIPRHGVTRLRFDPHDNDSVVWIGEVRILGGRGASGAVEIAPRELFAGENIARIVPEGDGIRVVPVPGTNDPQLYVVADTFAPAEAPRIDLLLALFAAVLVAGVLLLVIEVSRSRISTSVVAVSALILAGALIVAMAVASTWTKSVHPDEFAHVGAYRYFVGNWMPPAVDDPAVMPSLSNYGISYLFHGDPVYFIAAKVTLPVAGLVANDVLTARLFNVLLWSMLVAIAIVQRRWAWALIVLLLSPQIWYVFSYFNNDALPFALSLICAGMLVDERSGLHRYVRDGGKLNLAAVAFVVALGLLLLSKRNFVPLVPILLLWLGAIHLRLGWFTLSGMLAGLTLGGVSLFLSGVPAVAAWGIPAVVIAATLVIAVILHTIWRVASDADRRPLLMRLTLLAILSGGVALPWVAADFLVNGPPSEKSARILEVREAYADDPFKPSALEAGNLHPGLSMASRGRSFEEAMFAPFHWGAFTLSSAFGVYGYMNIHAPRSVNSSLPLVTLAVFLLAAVYLIRSRNTWEPKLVLVACGSAVLFIAIAFMHSWVNDFQAQGRYLLPVFTLIALMVGTLAERLHQSVLKLLLLSAAILGVISFAGFALPALT